MNWCVFKCNVCDIVFYRSNYEGRKDRVHVTRERCEKCSAVMACVRIQKTKPTSTSVKVLVLGAPLNARILGLIAPRGSASVAAVQTAAIAMAESTGEEGKEEKKHRDLDPDFAPPAQVFHIKMRLALTSKHRRVVRVGWLGRGAGALLPTVSAPMWSIRAALKGVRSTQLVMGTAVNGSGSLSAADHCGRADAEWLHLIADCLGGATVADNLVAGSYAANTEMLAIEMLLMGRTTLSVTVTAHCSAPYVAEMITYTVHPPLTGKGRLAAVWIWRIDAKNRGFSEIHMAEIQESLKRWLAVVS